MSNRKRPEAIPEDQPEAPGTEWIKIPEAAVMLAMSERAARDWVKRHKIPQRGDRPVLVSAASIRQQLHLLGRTLRTFPEAAAEAPGGASEPIDVPFKISGSGDRALVPVDRMVAHVQGLAEQLVGLAQRNEALALEVGTLRERTATQERTIRELQTERDALASRPATPDAPTPAEEPAPPIQPQRGSRWRFWERAHAPS